MRLKKFLALVQIVCIIFFNVSFIRVAHGDDMDIFVNYVQPNVDLLISSSSSHDWLYFVGTLRCGHDVQHSIDLYDGSGLQMVELHARL